MFLLNSRSHHFTATPSRFASKSLHLPGRTFSRSYGANLPSSFTRVLSSALEFSSCPPVSVCGTVSLQLKLSGFSWKLGISNFVSTKADSLSRLRIDPPDLPKGPPTRLNRDIQHPACLTFSVPTSHHIDGTGILTCFPSTTHFCLALGADSPCADERCAGNLGLSAREPFTPFIATHVSIRTSDTSSMPHTTPSQAYRTLSYHSEDRRQRTEDRAKTRPLSSFFLLPAF